MSSPLSATCMNKMQEGNTRRFQAFQKMLHLLLGSVKPSLRHLHEHDAGGKHTTLSRLLKMLHLLLGSIKPSLCNPSQPSPCHHSHNSLDPLNLLCVIPPRDSCMDNQSEFFPLLHSSAPELHVHFLANLFESTTLPKPLLLTVCKHS